MRVRYENRFGFRNIRCSETDVMRPRRAVNQVYSIPLLRQQIDLPDALGDKFATDGQLRRLLGYDVRTPRSVAEYLAGRVRKS